MAIIKIAKNITREFTKTYLVYAKEIERTAETIEMKATCGNIELNSVKKIVANGNRN